MAGLLGSEESKNIIENYFGFRESPFGVTPDPRYFYDQSLYIEGLSQLIYGIQAKKGIMLLTGEGGTGKTTLLRKLMRHLPTTQFIVASSRHLTTDDLFELTAHELGLSSDNYRGSKMIQQLESFLIEKLKQKRYVALVIDEAQELGDDVLQGLCELSNLETDKEKLLQIVLVGQPELAQRLSKPALHRTKQRVAMHYRLSPLPTLSDVEQYMRHRLEIAGYVGPGIFDREAIEAIGAYTAGTPRLINAVCDNTLPLAAAAGRKKVTASMVEKAASLLMLERGSDLPVAGGAIEPLKATPQAEPTLEQNIASRQPDMLIAEITEESVPQPKLKEPIPISSRDAPPVRRTVNGTAAPEEKSPTTENADILRLKAAMASIKLGPPAKPGKEAETTVKSSRPESSALPQIPLRQPDPLSNDAPQVPSAPVSAIAEESSPVGIRTIAKDVGVPTKFFDFMIHEATEALGPIGEFVVKEHITDLGESRESFPRKKLLALVEAVGTEIGNKQMRANFEVTMRREIRGFRTF